MLQWPPVRECGIPLGVTAASDVQATAGRLSIAAKAAGRALATALVGAWLGYYIVTGMPQVRLDVFEPTVILHSVTVGLIVVYAGYLVAYQRLPGGTPMDWPVVLIVGAYALATAASVDWRVSTEAMLQVIMVIVVFYALSDIHIVRLRDVRRGLMLAGAAASFYALWQVGHDYADWLSLARSVDGGLTWQNVFPPTVPRVHDVSDHPNMLGMTLVLILPFYALALYRPESWWERVGGAVCLVAALLTIFLTLSRGAWVGAVVALAVAAGGIAVVASRARGVSLSPAVVRLWLGRPRAIAVVLAAGLAVFVILGGLLAASRWESRPQWLFRSSFSPRQDALSAGFDMFKDHPFLGAGPDTYALLYPEYSNEYPIHAIHSHNAYLQAAIDLGIVGLAALLFLAAAGGRVLWHVIQRGSLLQQLVAVACGAALAGFLVHATVDAPNMWKAPLIALAAVAAILLRTYREAKGEDNAPGGEEVPEAGGPPQPPSLPAALLSLAPRVFLPLTMVAMLTLWGWMDTAHFYYARSADRAAEGRLLEAGSDLSRAVDIDPHLAIYPLQLGLTEVRVYQEGGPRLVLEQAIQHLRKGVELEPRSAIGYMNLARALQMAGEDQEAREAAWWARRWGGTDETVALAAGSVFEDLGDAELAVFSYAKAISLDPRLLESPFWTSSPFRQEHYGDIISHSSLASNPCVLASTLARAGVETVQTADKDLDQLAHDCAAQLLDSPNEVELRVQYGEILTALGDLDKAEQHLRLAVQRQPENASARTALGKWYAAQGDLESARQEWLLAAQLDDADGALLLGDSYPPGEVPNEVIETLEDLMPSLPEMAGVDYLDILYFRMRFARASPATILIPGEWQQALSGRFAAMEDALHRWQSEQATPGS